MGYQDRNYYQYDQDVDLRPSWNQRSAVTQLIVANVAVFFINMLIGDVTTDRQGWVNEQLMLQPDTHEKPRRRPGHAGNSAALRAAAFR
ncbi:MAG: hypothetical protein ACKOCH_25450, partial [Bacteroidota bacterium]